MTEYAVQPVRVRSIGTDFPRVDGVEKVTGRATYAAEQQEDVPGDPLHLWLVQSTIAKGRVLSVDGERARSHPGVVDVVDHTTAPRLADTENGELAILQDAAVGFRGQIVALVLAETPEAAREGAALVEWSTTSSRTRPSCARTTPPTVPTR